MHPRHDGRGRGGLTLTTLPALPALPSLGRIAARYLLPVWFGIFSFYYAFWILAIYRTAGLDARIYYRAAQLWVSGGDPWTAAVYVPAVDRSYHFAGLPPTVVAFAPFTLVPEVVVQWLWVGGSFAAGAWIIRRLRLPWWWLLFPPLVQGALSGNPGIVLLALLLAAHPLAEAVAAALKVYAVVPMLVRGHWRGLAVFVAVCIASATLFPHLWLGWVGRAGTVSTRLIDEADGGTGATAYWWLIPPTLLAVIVIAWLDRPAAAWLVIPAFWPATQFHYAVMALPVIRLLPAVMFAVPVYGMPAVAVMLHAWLLVREEVNSAKVAGGDRLHSAPAGGGPARWQAQRQLGPPEPVDTAYRGARSGVREAETDSGDGRRRGA